MGLLIIFLENSHLNNSINTIVKTKIRVNPIPKVQLSSRSEFLVLITGKNFV